MKGTLSSLTVAVCAVAMAVACSKRSSQPSAPSGIDPSLVDATEGSTLKATAPSLQSPINGVQLPANEPVELVIGNATTYAGVPLSYRFELTNAAGDVVEDVVVEGGSGSTVRTVTTPLESEQMYQWRARAEYEGAGGPWSGRQAFIAPQSEGYIRGNEIYDPLINGKTVGEIHGAVELIPGVGAKLLDWNSYISYQLPETLYEGEYSLLVTNMPANTEGAKQKVMAMAQGYSDLTTNDRRMTVEKRGDPQGTIAFRFLTHDDAAETVGSERRGYPFQADRLYLFQATWRNNFFNVNIMEDGAEGHTVYDFGKPYHGRPYDPNPHVVFVGAPVGRSGSEAASIENAIYKQIWVSPNPRPAFANK
jgi:hypothetical protein